MDIQHINTWWVRGEGEKPSPHNSAASTFATQDFHMLHHLCHCAIWQQIWITKKVVVQTAITPCDNEQFSPWHSVVIVIHAKSSAICMLINQYQSFIQSINHSFIHSFIHSFSQSVSQSVSQSFIHSFIHSFSHSVSLSVIHSFIHSFIQSFIRVRFVCCLLLVSLFRRTPYLVIQGVSELGRGGRRDWGVTDWQS